MSDNPVSIGSWLGRGWSTFTANASSLMIGFLIYIAFYAAIAIFGGAISEKLAPVVALLVIPSIAVGWVWLCLRTLRGEKLGGQAILDGFRFFVPALIAATLYGLVVGIGTVFLAIPGLYLALRYCMTFVALADRNLPAIEAMKYSAKITTGHKWRILGLVIIAVPIVAISLIPAGLGLLVTVPWMTAAAAASYDSLAASAANSAMMDEPADEQGAAG